MQLLAMLGVGDAVGLVAVSLARLGQKDQRRGIGGLSREGEVEQNERIDVELRPADDVDQDPDRDEDRLPDQERRRAEEAGEILGLPAEPIVSERRFEGGVR